MKRSIGKAAAFACALLLQLSDLVAGETAFSPGTQKEKESYSIGYQVGLSMRNDGVTVDPSALFQGVQDAAAGREARLDAKEMQRLIRELKKSARESKTKKFEEQGKANAAESRQFLEENRHKPGVQTTASGLQYLVLKEGEGQPPGLKDFVKVGYRGTFIDGRQFESTYDKGEPALVRVDRVIRGWSEALAMMKPGARWRLFLPPELAYGRRGIPGSIPPNKVLVFDLELLDFEKEPVAGQVSQKN